MHGFQRRTLEAVPTCCGHTALTVESAQCLGPSRSLRLCPLTGFSRSNSENPEGNGLLTCLLGKRPEHFIGFFLCKESEDQVSGVGGLEGHAE